MKSIFLCKFILRCLDGMKVLAPNGESVTCQTTLLDSDESLDKSKQNAGFPTSTWVQFYILLIRTFLSIFRDQVGLPFVWIKCRLILIFRR